VAENWTLAQSFAFFGAVATNRVWSWSARSADEKTVVLTLWEDEITRDSGRIIYDMRNHPKRETWQKKLGNRDRTKNLALAYGNPEVTVRAVRIKAADTKARTRSIVNRYPDPALYLKITHFDPQTGEFRAEEISG
jgi:hypothetical protein